MRKNNFFFSLKRKQSPWRDFSVLQPLCVWIISPAPDCLSSVPHIYSSNAASLATAPFTLLSGSDPLSVLLCPVQGSLGSLQDTHSFPKFSMHRNCQGILCMRRFWFAGLRRVRRCCISQKLPKGEMVVRMLLQHPGVSTVCLVLPSLPLSTEPQLPVLTHTKWSSARAQHPSAELGQAEARRLFKHTGLSSLAHERENWGHWLAAW